MFEKPMTKETEKLLCLIYKDYLNKISVNQPKQQAVMFNGYSSLSDETRQNVTADEFEYALDELSKLNFIKRYIRSNFMLEPAAIVYMENRFGKTISGIVDVISKFIP